MTIPLSAEIIKALKAAETDRTLPALKQETPGRRRRASPRRKAPKRIDELAA